VGAKAGSDGADGSAWSRAAATTGKRRLGERRCAGEKLGWRVSRQRQAKRAHGHEQAELECNVPSNSTRRRSCGGKLLRKMRECDGRIEDAAKVFDKMPMRAVLKNVRVLLLGEASRVQDAVGRMLRRCAEQRCAGAARQGRGERGSSR
jgi:hypothetical protein